MSEINESVTAEETEPKGISEAFHCLTHIVTSVVLDDYTAFTTLSE